MNKAEKITIFSCLPEIEINNSYLKNIILDFYVNVYTVNARLSAHSLIYTVIQVFFWSQSGPFFKFWVTKCRRFLLKNSFTKSFTDSNLIQKRVDLFYCFRYNKKTLFFIQRQVKNNLYVPVNSSCGSKPCYDSKKS